MLSYHGNNPSPGTQPIKPSETPRSAVTVHRIVMHQLFMWVFSSCSCQKTIIQLKCVSTTTAKSTHVNENQAFAGYANPRFVMWAIILFYFVISFERDRRDAGRSNTLYWLSRSATLPRFWKFLIITKLTEQCRFSWVAAEDQIWILGWSTSCSTRSPPRHNTQPTRYASCIVWGAFVAEAGFPDGTYCLKASEQASKQTER